METVVVLREFPELFFVHHYWEWRRMNWDTIGKWFIEMFALMQPGAPWGSYQPYTHVIYKTARTFECEGDLYESITGHRSAIIDAKDKAENQSR